MRVVETIRRLIEPSTTIDRRLRRTLALGVASLLDHGRLTVAELGRQLPSASLPKHNIKRMDRLVGNSRLHANLGSLQSTVALELCRGVERPCLLVDWTDLRDGKVALMASVPIEGRALPILWQVHPKSKYGGAKIHRHFLDRLAKLLPASSKPILVADAGFQAPFQRDVARRQWGFVIRVRGSRRRFGLKRLTYGQVLRKATQTPQDLGEWVSRKDDLAPRLILAARPKKRRRKLKRRWQATAYYRKRETEPWLLVTNLWRHSPEDIVQIYARRMGIEEAIRDTKSPRYGWALDFSGTHDSARLEVLLMISALASTVAVLMGMAAERAGLHRAYQANTEKRRVLSLVTLGRAVLRRQHIDHLEWRRSLSSIHKSLRDLGGRAANSSAWELWWELNKQLGTDPFSSAAYAYVRP